MSIIDEGVIFETVWNGAEGWLDNKRGDFPRKMLSRVDYLDTAPVEKPRMEPNAYRRVLACLPQAKRWTTDRLREESLLSPAEFEMALNKLRRDGVLVSVKRGIVLVSAKVAA